MPYATGPRADIYFTDSGGPGPALILGHGFLLDNSMFERQSELSDTVRLITWDARGHGETRQKDDAPYTYWDQADDVLAVMDAAGVESGIVGGMSQGGFSALRTALKAPDRITGLVLIGTTAGETTPEEAAGYRELFGAWMSDVPLEPLAEALAPQLIGGDAADQEPWVNKWLSSDRYRIKQAVDCLSTRDAVLDRLDQITCPTLIVRGSEDTSFDQPHTEALLNGIPSATEIVEVSGAGHAANWTDPEPVNAALRKFLAELG